MDLGQTTTNCPTATADAKPACQNCRKRKLRCSRDVPNCTNCSKTGNLCVYDTGKEKPGLRTGAVESLRQRVDALERAMEDRIPSPDASSDHCQRAFPARTDHRDQPELWNVLSFIIQELKTPNEALHYSKRRPLCRSSACSGVAEALSTARSGLAAQKSANESTGEPFAKRRRTSDTSMRNTSDLPNLEILKAIVEAYFQFVQPWVPMLCETTFRGRFAENNRQIEIILHAMTTVAFKFVKQEDIAPHLILTEDLTRRSRDVVVLNAMDDLSVENLQALIIVAFEDIGNGKESRAWSIVGSLTRTVEYLQLSVEIEEDEKPKLLKPRPLIPKTHHWTELEERRRVFWTVFLLDRFCSITSGWNTSLTSDDVHRRLPADGNLWHRGRPVRTPYFGIWDKSAGKIGNSIAFLPSHPHSVGLDKTSHCSPDSDPSMICQKSDVDMSTIGAFAYCIEATESLSQVTTYFLQQKVDFRDRQDITNWLMRFKELDLRLIHWRMFLPQKWKDSDISRQPAIVTMDPNLTVAHITHNTSLILLHQRIAYPPPECRDMVKLPSSHSAETCQIAAIETADIAKKYMENCPTRGIVSGQFAFCVFVNARVLLIHWRHHKSALRPEFWTLVGCLATMSTSWAGRFLNVGSTGDPNLPKRYFDQLHEAYEKCKTDDTFFLDIFGYSTEGSGTSNSAQNETREKHNDAQTERRSGVFYKSKHEDDCNQSHRHFGEPDGIPLASVIESGASGQSDQSIQAMQRQARVSELPEQMPPTNVGHLTQPTDEQVTEPFTADDDPAGQVTHTIVPDPDASQPFSSGSPDQLTAVSQLLLDQQFLDMDRIISFDNALFTSEMVGGRGPDYISMF